jgi:hypothetical protein
MVSGAAVGVPVGVGGAEEAGGEGALASAHDVNSSVNKGSKT